MNPIRPGIVNSTIRIQGSFVSTNDPFEILVPIIGKVFGNCSMLKEINTSIFQPWSIMDFDLSDYIISAPT